MLALDTSTSLYCPSYSMPTRLVYDKVLLSKFRAHLACSACGLIYQLATQADALKVALACDGDMIELLVREELDRDDNID